MIFNNSGCGLLNNLLFINIVITQIVFRSNGAAKDAAHNNDNYNDDGRDWAHWFSISVGVCSIVIVYVVRVIIGSSNNKHVATIFSLTSWSIGSPLLSITEFMVILLSATFPCITISVCVEVWDSVQLKVLLNYWDHGDILLKSSDTLLTELFINLKKNSFVFHQSCYNRHQRIMI